VEDSLIDAAKAQKILKDLREKQELTQFTLENNKITDVEGMCQIFLHLKSYDKLEGINFRQNNFDDRLIEALAEGIKMKKELRVS
jgi:Leucine-rich repeat (LRR) protein